jgi:excinuclease ABC subunit C
MLALARDEAHRASNALRTKLGKKRRLTSSLDGVPGLGPKTRKKLLRALGSAQAVREADAAALVAAGASATQAAAIRAHVEAQTAPTEATPATSESEEAAVDNAFRPG